MSEEIAMAMDWRRVIEALRSGVPNREAARAMGSNQDAVEQLFHPKLAQVSAQLTAGQQVTGLLISGGFGSGKSHLLEYLEDRALAERFVCSRIVIGKETPLYDPGKLFRAAVGSAVVRASQGKRFKSWRTVCAVYATPMTTLASVNGATAADLVSAYSSLPACFCMSGSRTTRRW